MRRTSAIVALASLTMLARTPAIEAQGEGQCGLLSTAEVQKAFPDSKPGRLDRGLEKLGTLTCVWDYPTGQFSIIGTTTNDQAEESVKEEATGWTSAFVDPLRAGAERHVRYEVLPGVGDEAIAVVEREDPAKGFTTSAAILVVRRGKRQVSAVSTTLARGERAEALRVLTELGKAIAKRLN